MAKAVSLGAPGKPSPGELRARKMLLWGAGLLVLGLALVGVGQGTVGSIPVLAGLLATIAAIHVYGRLGPDEIDPVDDLPGAPADEEPKPRQPRRPRRTKARVENRRRMDKSRAP